MKNNPEKLNFINLDKYLSVELLLSHGLEQLYKSRYMLVVELAVEF